MSQGAKRTKNKLSDEKVIDVISKSIGQILRSSPNEDFRKKSFDVLKVFSTKEVEEHVSKELYLILNEKNQLTEKRRKNNQAVPPELKSSNLPHVVFTSNTYELAGKNLFKKLI